MAGHEWEDWFEREEFIGQISDMRVQNLQVEREVVQKRTFTRWINLHLEKCDPPIEVHDLFQDIQDGHILMALLEELSGCKLLHGFKKSSHRIFRLNNIAKVLSFLEERNVKLVSIDAADVADGNPSIILGLIWNIILFFQIKELTGNIRCQFPSSSSFSSIPTSSDSDASLGSMPSDEGQLASMAIREQSKAIKKLLQWVQKRTRKFGVAVLDFGKSWTSGLAFLAVIKSIDPSLLDMRKALLRTARENLEEAFRIAHYSLGIPRLLEPEDIIVKAPDEQSIITYVSQFLEHFPGIEEPEESCLLIERSISLCRLNFRDADSKNMRNGAHRNTVKERSHMFQGDCSPPAPKILISSVSEDRGTMARPLRPPASRSWSSEDFLADSSFNIEDFSNTVVDEPQQTDTKDISNPALISHKVSCPQSSTCSSVVGSVNSESVTADSAINSPDSWEGSDLGVMVETLCESQSDSSICDSGTVCDVYRATPVEITILDEGLVLTQEEEVQQTTNVQTTTESLLDEAICSQSSSESTQEKFQGHSLNKLAGEMREEEACFDNHIQEGASEVIPISNEAEVTNIDAKHKQKLALGPFDVKVPSSCDVENVLGTETTTQAQPIDNTELPTADNTGEFIKQSVGKSINREPESSEKVEGHDSNALNHEAQSSGQTESPNKSNISEEGEPEITSQKIVPPFEKESVKSSIYADKEVVQTQDKISEGVSRDSLDLQESFRSVTSDVSANTCPTSLDPSHGRNIPLISIFNELEEQDVAETCETAATVSKESDPGVNSSKNLDEVSCDQSNRDAEIPNRDAEIPFYPVTDHEKPTETDINRSSHKDMCQQETSQNQEISETKQECKSANIINSDKNLRSQTSFGVAEVELMKTEWGTDQQDKMGDSITVQEDKLNPAYLQHNGKIGTAGKDGSVSTATEKEFLDFDQNSPIYDLVGDTVEPMDIFYPEKEDPILSEPLDTEVQSWPLVLSVSALQPAPAKDSLPGGQPLHLDEDPWSKESSIHKSGEEISMANQETDEVLPSQEQCLPLGEEKGSLLVDVSPGNSDANEKELRRSGSAKKYIEPVRDLKSYSREDESQIPSVLGHKKDLNFSQPMINQTAVDGVADKDDSNIWMSENSELYLLLLLWILLYCFWLLPQMDLKALPNLLLNL